MKKLKAQRLFLASPWLIIFLPTTEMRFDAIGYGGGARISFAPNSLFRPDKADLLPCYRELIPCSVAQGICLVNN